MVEYPKDLIALAKHLNEKFKGDRQMVRDAMWAAVESSPNREEWIETLVGMELDRLTTEITSGTIEKD
jgi:hypothetical protein